MEYKTSTLLSFCVGGYSYALRIAVQRNGSFKNKGVWRVVKYKMPSKAGIRDRDRKYMKALGVNMKGLENHHDWENGAVTYLLTPEQHKQKGERGLLSGWIC